MWESTGTTGVHLFSFLNDQPLILSSSECLKTHILHEAFSDTNMTAIITYDTVCSCLNQVQVWVYIQYHNRAHFYCELNEVQMLLQKKSKYDLSGTL